MFDFFTEEDFGFLGNCKKCGLPRNPIDRVIGDGGKGVLIVMGSPEPEQMSLKSFRAGTYDRVNKLLVRAGIDPTRDCWVTGSVLCPITGSKARSHYVNHCQENIRSFIKWKKPSVILLLGLEAVAGVIPWESQLGTIYRWRGYQIPDREYGAWLCPTYAPSHVEEKNWSKAVVGRFEAEVLEALKCADKPLPEFKESVEILHDEDEVCRRLSSIKEPFAFDYETTGLKPHRKGHRIVSCGISETPDTAYAFMMTDKVSESLKVLLTSDVGKYVANLQFESIWTQATLKCKVNNWMWDTMLAAKIMDNRVEIAEKGAGITGVKFQAYVNFGVRGYEEEMKKYFEADGNNDFNKIEDCPVDALLKYNALDALYEHKLALKQMETIKLANIEEVA